MSTMGKSVKEKVQFEQRTLRILTVMLWLGAFSPVLAITILLLKQPDDEMPSIEMLENPPELLASVVFADDGKTELGRFWSVNRTSVKYNEISPYVFDALIATEDERIQFALMEYNAKNHRETLLPWDINIVDKNRTFIC